VELIFRRGPDLDEVATAVVLRRRSLRRGICMHTSKMLFLSSHADNRTQVVVLAQCTMSYLAVGSLQLGITPEDYIVTEYESWMGVRRLAVIIHLCNSFTDSIAGDVYRPDPVHPQHGLVQVLDNAVPQQPGFKQEAHDCFDHHYRPEYSLDGWLVRFHRSAWGSLCTVE
jgi:hypothetical protein